ncbi:hypothetical protein FHT79_002374 [Rhizobium sp. BK212]|nr:hypothetical protein [Rhizobium sp. BK212]
MEGPGAMSFSYSLLADHLRFVRSFLADPRRVAADTIGWRMPRRRVKGV